MIRVAVLGASGRVGRLVLAAILDADDLLLVAAVGRAGSGSRGTDAGVLAGRPPCGVPLVPIGPSCFVDAQVVVDFSQPDALRDALPLLDDRALVTGTTGLDPTLQGALAARAAAAPVLHAANFSTGVTLLRRLVATAARALPDYDVEIVESHHRRKVDAPSGTALLLAHAAAEARGVRLDAVGCFGRHGQTGARPRGEIAVHALRMGDVVGDHTVWLAGDGDRLCLGHVATSRETFAAGALRAARWISGRPAGSYAMEDVLGL